MLINKEVFLLRMRQNKNHFSVSSVNLEMIFGVDSVSVEMVSPGLSQRPIVLHIYDCISS
jgi:hypothetical protein